ncbi:MAG: hypothetical protein PHN61_06415 [Methanothrix sp.]|nr:hypothetical protein [Methanothrix sp.]
MKSKGSDEVGRDIARGRRNGPQAETLKEATRLVDLSVWMMEMVKPTTEGNRFYHYWMATRSAGGKMQNVHLGNCGKMVEETAKQKARSMKAAALAIKI